ncbi:hypothetical protein MNBD_PLANCTO03-1429 [hydrothermal vent metagenome]|uniref:Uncharacterized protein n=1 Tax=hydrothermal vent metagenome TaxID=652676 RepID=A0A3B1DUQ2_9ZZZZ
MLAKWTEFAQASVALPADHDGPRWKACVPPIITMQALVAALAELDQLPLAHRPVAIDAAETLLREQLRLIHEAWVGEIIPESITELIEESRQAVFDARHTGLEWRVIDERIEAPNLRPVAEMMIEAGFRGDLHAARAGTALFCGAPLAFFRPALEVNPPDGCAAVEVVGPRQCYRQLDDATGLPVRDVVAGPGDPLQPGAPLLAPMIVDGVLAPSVTLSAPVDVPEPLPVIELA